MVVRRFGATFLVMFVSACDHFPGPTIVNTFSMDLTATLAYSDGQIVRWRMPRCVEYQVGKDGAVIERISIESGGKLLHELSADDVRAMLEKEKTIKGSPEWFVQPDGVVLIDRFQPNLCAEKAE